MGVLATRSELWIGVARAFVEYQQKVPSPHDVITLNNDGGTLKYIFYMFLLTASLSSFVSCHHFQGGCLQSFEK